MSFLYRSHQSNDRLSYWGGPMAGRFSPRLQRYAMQAARRWGLLDPSPDDLMTELLGADWMTDHPGLASLITSYAIGGEHGKPDNS